MNDSKVFAKNLSRELVAARKSRQELLDTTGVAKNTLGRWLSEGIKEARGQTLQQLRDVCAELGISSEQIDELWAEEPYWARCARLAREYALSHSEAEIQPIIGRLLDEHADEPLFAASELMNNVQQYPDVWDWIQTLDLDIKDAFQTYADNNETQEKALEVIFAAYKKRTKKDVASVETKDSTPEAPAEEPGCAGLGVV